MKQTQRDLSELKKHLRKSTSILKTLKDDLKVELHLAGMEATTKWKRFAPRFAEVERMARELTASSKEAVRKLGGR